jgi:NADPH-dependent curcumin reductase CurA
MLRLFEETPIEPAIDTVVDLADVPLAAERLLTGDQFGKVVVRVSD